MWVLALHARDSTRAGLNRVLLLWRKAHENEEVIVEPERRNINLGDLISLFYEEYLALYNGDEELAAVAAAATINELLRDAGNPEQEDDN
jgi:hypothetical protein